MPQKTLTRMETCFYHTTSAHMLWSTLVHAERSKIPWLTILDPLDVDPAGSTMLDPRLLRGWKCIGVGFRGLQCQFSTSLNHVDGKRLRPMWESDMANNHAIYND